MTSFATAVELMVVSITLVTFLTLGIFICLDALVDRKAGLRGDERAARAAAQEALRSQGGVRKTATAQADEHLKAA